LRVTLISKTVEPPWRSRAVSTVRMKLVYT
jgi:hypothetical protein